VTVLPCCEASGGGGSEWISTVGLNEVNHESGNDAGYASFDQVFEPVTLGSSATLYLEPSFALSAYEQRWRVWIDYNEDEVFDLSEMVFQSQSDTAVQGGFSVPLDEQPGIKTMRVIMQLDNGSWPEPCDQTNTGEVEDYQIEFKEP